MVHLMIQSKAIPAPSHEIHGFAAVQSNKTCTANVRHPTSCCSRWIEFFCVCFCHVKSTQLFRILTAILSYASLPFVLQLEACETIGRPGLIRPSILLASAQDPFVAHKLAKPIWKKFEKNTGSGSPSPARAHFRRVILRHKTLGGSDHSNTSSNLATTWKGS